MRKIAIAVGVLLVIVIAVVVVAVSNLNGYLEENRDTLSKLASDAAGRSVSFDRAEVAFAGGLAVRVAGLRVAEDPRFGKPDFLSLDGAFVGVRILPALQGRVEVSGIRLDAPTIRVIQTADGFNFASLGGGGEVPPPSSSEAPPPSGSEEESAPLALAIAALEITDGTIVFEDRTSAEGLALVIEAFESSGTDLALEGPIAIDFAGRVSSSKPADAGLESDIEGEVDLAGLDPLEGTVKLRSQSLYPAIFGVRLEEGEVVEHLDALTIDVALPADPPKSGYPVAVRSNAARLAGFDLDDIAIDVNYRGAKGGSDVTLDQVAVGLAGGRVDLTGDFFLGEPGASPFDLKASIRGIESGELAAVLLGVPREALSGVLEGDVELAGDSLEWESLERSLVGKLRLDVGEGALEQVNVLRTLVGRLSASPGIGQLAASLIQDVAPGVLSRDRTPFDGIDMALEVLDGAIHAKDLQIAARDFGIQAAGKVGLDGSVAADGTFTFSKELSRKLLDKGGQIARVLDQDGAVVLPLQFGGTTGSPLLLPDLAALSGGVGREVENRAAKELTDAIFGKRKKGDDADPEDEGKRNAAKSLLKKGLGKFLGR